MTRARPLNLTAALAVVAVVDLVVHRHELRATIAKLCRLLLKTASSAPQSSLPAPSAAMAPAIA